MSANPLLQLIEFGQSYWLDNLTRGKIAGGELERRVREEGLRGVTSNPAIFHKAITGSPDYDARIRQLFDAGGSPEQVYEALVVADVRDACDILRPVFDREDGADGFVSLEVSPHLAHDSEATVIEARRLFKAVDRPNLFIKIPGTAAGVAAVEQCLFEGIPVNITLLFSVAAYEAVAKAYLRALERRLEAAKPLRDVASVASFFLSRIDLLVDQLLTQRFGTCHDAAARQLLGQAAIANAKLAYHRFQAIFSGERWQALANLGAHPQRVLWASTSTKNPAYRDVMYVEPLIGPHTVNTLPDETIVAFAEHGQVAATVAQGVKEARQTMRDLAALGIDFAQVAAQLENEGVQKFIDPYDALLRALAAKGGTAPQREEARALREVAQSLRRQVVMMTSAAGSGHPSSCLSCADLVAALFFHEMRWDPRQPLARDVDRLVLSKGHAAPILWAALAEAGALSEDPMSLRRLDSSLEGHPTPGNAWVKVATGSLGQGLSAANGMALADRLDGIDARVYCLLGDGECAEGSVWEAAQFAVLHRLEHLVAIVDVNGLGQSGPAPSGHDTALLAGRFKAFGWRSIEIDGHDMDAILVALEAARSGGPTAIVARTVKGKGVSFLENAEGWHGKPVSREQLDWALTDLGAAADTPPAPLQVVPRHLGPLRRRAAKAGKAALKLAYAAGQQVATREAYGHALQQLGAHNPAIVVLDGDVKNSTYAEFFAKAYPERYFECWIAEQNMVGVALGLAAEGKIPFVSSFAAFLTRAGDFIRMAAHSRPKHLVFCGSHAGVSIGEDGPSQMGLEDIALFRALPGSTVLYPSDAVSAARLTELAAETEGIVYLRTSRPKTALLYAADETFTVGGSKLLRSSRKDRFTIVAAGITLHEALAAHDSLLADGIAVRVIDAYSVKPLDVATLLKAARDTEAILVVEDHWPDGGLGDAVAKVIGEATHLHFLAVTSEPHSGTAEQLLDRHGISRLAIAARVRELARKPPGKRAHAAAKAAVT